jgi:hypothetical protein
MRLEPFALISFPCPLLRSLPSDVVLGVGATFVEYIGWQEGGVMLVKRQPF